MSNDTGTLVLASTRLSERLGVEKGAMLTTIKAQCFRSIKPDDISDAQLAAYVNVAHAIGVNPLLPGMLYAYPERNGGMTPIIGPDGIFAMLSNNPEIEGWSTKHEKIDGEDVCTATIKHKRLGDISKTVFLSEWKVGSNPNWQTRPRHMLEIRALKQCARQVIHGVPFDEDEYKETLKNVTASAGNGADPAAVEAVLPPADGSAPAAQTESTRPKTTSRRGSGRAGAEVVVESEATPEKVSAPTSPVASPTATAPSAEGQKTAAEPSSSKTEVTATPAPAAMKAAQPEKPAASAQETAAGAFDHAKGLPLIADKIGLGGFYGKPWPLMADVEIKKIDRTAVTPSKVPLIIFKAVLPGHADELEIVTTEHVKLGADGVPQITDINLLAAGKTVNAKFVAKQRGAKTNVPPAIWAEGITETQSEF